MKKIWLENYWLIIISAVVIILTTVPYLIGFNLQNEEFQFSGFIIGVEDGNSYLAKMMLGAFGKWLFTTPYTAFPQMEFFAFFPYIFLGKLASNPEIRLQLLLIFHLFRILGIIFLIYETYHFSKTFLKDSTKSLLATFLLIFGGGFGWLGVIIPGLVGNRMPLEFYSPETFGFLSAFSLPHLLFGRAFLYKSFRNYLDLNLFNTPNKQTLLRSGFYLLISGIFQPLNLIVGWAVMGVYSIFKLIKQKEPILKLLPLTIWLIPSLPLLLYNFLSFIFDPFLSTWQGQNKIPSPPLIDYLLSYGLGIAAIIIIFIKKWISKISNPVFLYAWLIVLPILIYFPINIQRRLAEGVWICFCILLAVLIFQLKNRLFRYLIVLLISLPSVLFIFGALNTVRNISAPVYIPTSIVQISNAMEKEIQIDDVVLAPFYESNVLPSYLPVKVLTGHGPESMNFDEISKYLDSFYSGKFSNNETKEFINKFNIRFILVPKLLSYEKIEKQLSLYDIINHYQNNEYLLVEVNEKP